MKRAIFSTFLAATLLLMIASHPTMASRRHNLPMVPPATIETTAGTLTPSAAEDKRVSITFWSSHDAASRLENIQRSIAARADTTVTHIGMNIDDAPAIFREYLRHDNLQADSNQYLAADEAARTLQDTYGYGTLYY